MASQKQFSEADIDAGYAMIRQAYADAKDHQLKAAREAAEELFGPVGHLQHLAAALRAMPNR